MPNKNLDLYHYYERRIGPFVNLSDLSIEEASRVQKDIRKVGGVSAEKRDEDYLIERRQLESKVRELFIQKGGKPVRENPQYMTLGPCPWLKDSYVEGCELKIPVARFNLSVISFTYGDTFPAMRYNDGKPYRGVVYTLDEIGEVIDRFGMPQDWNSSGKLGPERYIEAQIWDDEPLKEYINKIKHKKQ